MLHSLMTSPQASGLEAEAYDLTVSPDQECRLGLAGSLTDGSRGVGRSSGCGGPCLPAHVVVGSRGSSRAVERRLPAPRWPLLWHVAGPTGLLTTCSFLPQSKQEKNQGKTTKQDRWHSLF